jgi:hypothetical protein
VCSSLRNIIPQIRKYINLHYAPISLQSNAARAIYRTMVWHTAELDICSMQLLTALSCCIYLALPNEAQDMQ